MTDSTPTEEPEEQPRINSRDLIPELELVRNTRALLKSKKQWSYGQTHRNIVIPKEKFYYSRMVQGSFLLIFLLFFMFFLTQDSTFIPYLLPSVIILFVIHDKASNSNSFDLEKLHIQRRLSRDRQIEGKDFEVTIIVKNTSDKGSELIEVIDEVPTKFNLSQGLNRFIFQIGPHESRKLTYVCKGNYIGIFKFDALQVIATDLLGVRIRSLSLSAKNIKELAKEITIIPKLDKITTLPVAESWLRFYNGNFKSKSISLDSDFRSVREFQYGDSLRSINWKKTAKYQGEQHQLYSNTFNVNMAVNAEIIFDSTYSSGSVWTEGLRQVMSLTDFLLKNRNKVGLTVMNQYPEYIKPKFGKRHLRKMIDTIMNLDVEEPLHEGVIFQRLNVIMSKFDSNSVIIIISPFLSKVAFDFVKKLKKRNFKILAITPKAIQHQINGVKNSNLLGTVLGAHPVLLKLTEASLIMHEKRIDEQLRREKIFQIKWNPALPLESAFNYVKVTY